MISVNLMGRFGNQLFQIATAESLAIDNGASTVYFNTVAGTTPKLHETMLYMNTYYNKINFLPHNLIKSFKFNVCSEKEFAFNPIRYSPNMLLNGYFQSEKYFFHNGHLIKKLLSMPDKQIKVIKQLHPDLFATNLNDYACVHVRRGDYVNLSNVHTNLAEDTNYYIDAMREFENKKFIFFSDDISWCANYFGKEHTYFTSACDIYDFYIMGLFNNVIMSNSTYSWWSTWLYEKDDKKIIAPKKWFSNNINSNDLIPNRWSLV